MAKTQINRSATEKLQSDLCQSSTIEKFESTSLTSAKQKIYFMNTQRLWWERDSNKKIIIIHIKT